MSNILRIILLARPYYRIVIAVSLLILIGAILQQAAPLIIKNIVDLIEQKITTGEGNISTLYYLTALMFLSWILSTAVNSVSSRLGDYASSRIGKYLVEQFYRKILLLPQNFFDHELSGKIANQLTRGISSTADFLGAMTNFILPALMQSLFTVFLLFYYSPALGLMGALIFPVYIWISHISTKKWGQAEIGKNQLEDEYKGRLQEVVANIKLVKAANAQPIEYHYTSKIIDKINQIYDRQSFQYHVLNFVRNFFLELVLLIMGIWSFYGTYVGIFSFGVLVLIMQLVSQLRRPLFAMSFILERIQKAEAGAKEYVGILNIDAVENVSMKPKVQPPLFAQPTIKFDRVSFSYEQEAVLKNISLIIKPFETVAIVGHSGAGKTTVTNILLKFYEPSSGQIYLNDKTYHDLSHQQVRSHFSLVFQDNELFSTTVYENVSYGLKNVPTDKVISALKKAYAYDFVKNLPMGVHSLIGEKGARLSGGQKQRIQIARAFLNPAPIMILDEATASLDAKSEHMIYLALQKLALEKTLIIIAHRFSTIQNAGRIIVINRGKIEDAGTPQELSQKPGIYSELLKYQIEGNKKLLTKFDIIE